MFLVYTAELPEENVNLEVDGLNSRESVSDANDKTQTDTFGSPTNFNNLTSYFYSEEQRVQSDSKLRRRKMSGTETSSEYPSATTEVHSEPSGIGAGFDRDSSSAERDRRRDQFLHESCAPPSVEKIIFDNTDTNKQWCDNGSKPALIGDHRVSRPEQMQVGSKSGPGWNQHSSDCVGPQESMSKILVQIMVPFLVAGLGTVAAGALLDKVQYWPVFRSVTELFILVPALAGLKGNLEMTLASRLSTAANLGMMDTGSGLWAIVVDNMLITQLQSTVVGLLAALIAYALAAVQSWHLLQLSNAVVLCSASVITSILVNIVLSVLMILVVCLSRKLNLNPDNIATPVAASLGDLITISILACVSSFFYETIDDLVGIQIAFLLIIIMVIPFWSYVCNQNPSVRDVIKQSWTPIISAMMISSLGGLILDKAQKGFRTFAAFSPVICGTGGNLVAIQASRICTHLHANSPRKPTMSYQTLQEENDDLVPKCNENLDEKFKDSWCAVNSRFLSTFSCGSNPHSKSAVVLLGLVIPGDVLFVLLQTSASSLDLPLLFYPVFCLASFIQVFVLLMCADWLVHVIWKLGYDPDNCSIPYLTAFSDLLGTSLLVVGYLTLSTNYAI